MRKHLLIVLLIICSATAYARDNVSSHGRSHDNYDRFNNEEGEYSNFNKTTSTDRFRNWNDVVALLRYKGIEPSRINWTPIDAACLIHRGKEPAKFNECRYYKALDMNRYQSDEIYCNAYADRKYFEYIKPDVVINNSKSTNTIKLTREEAERLKRSAFITCMGDSGWSETGSWIGGRR